MKCPQCGKELKENTKFCDACGCPLAPAEQPQLNNQQTSTQRQMPPTQQWQAQPTPPIPQPKKPKKEFYKQWYFWVIIVVAVILIGCINGAINGGSNSKKQQKENTESTQSYTSANAETTVEPATEEETTEEPTTEEPTTQEPTKDPAQTEQEFKDSCSTISFEDLSRNPDKYKGNNYKFTGQVIQVQEGWFDTVELRINVTKEEFEYIDDVMWTDTIYATVTIPEGADKLLEDDVITFWGTCDGNYSYTSVLGNQISLPKIDIKYYELNN